MYIPSAEIVTTEPAALLVGAPHPDACCAVAPDAIATALAACGPARVLIVDDEGYKRRLLEIMLEPEGFDLATAACGREAIAAIERQPPDLVLLDINMPGMNGYE